MSAPQFKQYDSIYPVILIGTASMVMYCHYVVTHIGHKNYVYTNLCNSAEKSKIKDFNCPRNEPRIIIDYWSNKIEEDFNLHNPDNINICTT